MSSDQKKGFMQAASFLMITMIISRVLGYVRDMVIAAQIGQNFMTDAYNAAFTIPDTIYMLLVGGALSSSFIPVFSSYIAQGKTKEAWRVSSIVINWVMLLLIFLLTLGYIFTPQLIGLIAKGFDAQTMNMTVNLTRIMFVQVIFMSMAGISMGILNSFKIFNSPAIGSVLYNLGTIIFALLLIKPIEAIWPNYGIAAFSIGVVLGAVLYFAVQIPDLKRVGMKYEFSFNLANPGVRRLLKLMGPILIGLSITQLNLIINQNIASFLNEGLLSALRLAQRIMQMPIAIFAIAIAVAIFPTLTGYVATNQIEKFRSSFALGLRTIVFITMPCAVGLIILREPIVALFYQRGAFTYENTQAVAYTLVFYCIGLVAYAAIHILSRAFYSLQDTITPVLAGLGSVIVNIILSLYLSKMLAQGGIALAYSIAGIYNLTVLLILLRRKIGSIKGRSLLASFLQTSTATIAMALIVNMFSKLFIHFFGLGSTMLELLHLLVTVGAGILIFFAIAKGFKMEEYNQIMQVFGRRLNKKNKEKTA